MDTRPGAPRPRGATWDGNGTNFAVFCTATRRPGAVRLCLFGPGGAEEQVPLVERDAGVWHVHLPGVGPGTRYGFRVDGPYDPRAGHRCNPAKLLIDPYARAIDGDVVYDGAIYGGLPGDPFVPDGRDSAPFVPRSVVVDPAFDWGDDAPPATPLAASVVYEAHVRGLTMRHPDVAPELRGTYAGLASEPVLDHLVSLGVTAVELLPVHHFVTEPFLVDRGLTNHWGYASVGFFAPHGAYSASGTAGGQVTEFKSMVKALHGRGIEVLLDVVYNHTGEGSAAGPTLSFRGLDNAAYYRLDPVARDRYVDVTGTGNTLDVRHPEVLRLIMDSLRYWVTEMHVDGFRFDLASALLRDALHVDPAAAFFDILYQDPVLSRVKLIAEPWDVTDHGYLVGGFPPGWTEWNDRYRDTVRDYWRGWTHGVGELATRLSGSSDLYADDGRGPIGSLNFVTAHDGFTLADLVSYNVKHNEANLEGNADGTNNNRSWNCGVEGPTTDAGVIALRERQRRNFLVTLLASLGVPMLLAGDETGRTQGGNNNAYCQDNDVSWVAWDLDEPRRRLLAFTRRLIAFRRAQPVLHRRDFLHAGNVRWLRGDGLDMAGGDWGDGGRRLLGMLLDGAGIDARAPSGAPVSGDDVLLVVNAGDARATFTLPDGEWTLVFDAADPDGGPEPPAPVPAGGPLALEARAAAVLTRPGRGR